jgi:flagellar motor switch protein FliM
MINICIPHVVLEPILPKLSGSYWMESKRKESSSTEVTQLREGIKKAMVPVVAQLGKTEVTIEDFLSMGVGDVLDLGTGIGDPLTVCVGNVPKFIAQPGRSKKKLAVQILETLKGGDGDE